MNSPFVVRGRGKKPWDSLNIGNIVKIIGLILGCLASATVIFYFFTGNETLPEQIEKLNPSVDTEWAICTGTNIEYHDEYFSYRNRTNCTFSLKGNEYISGYAGQWGDDVGENIENTPCVVFSIIGPIKYQVEFDGEGVVEFIRGPILSTPKPDTLVKVLLEKVKSIESASICVDREVEIVTVPK